MASGSQGVIPAFFARGLAACFGMLWSSTLYHQALFEVAWRWQSILEGLLSATGLFWLLGAKQPVPFAFQGPGGWPQGGRPLAGGWPSVAEPWTQQQAMGAPAWASAPSQPGLCGAASALSTSPGLGAHLDAKTRGLFAAYLVSGLEVMREFTVRLQCLAAVHSLVPPDVAQPGVPPLTPGSRLVRAAASWGQPMRIADLESGVVQLLPLMQVSAAGLTGWVCLSRDLDKAGVVQREKALRRLVSELCAVLVALHELAPLVISGAIALSQAGAAALRAAEEEARHGLEELALCFERAGLWELELPKQYRGVLTDIAGLYQLEESLPKQYRGILADLAT